MQSSVPESFQVEQSKRAGQMLRSQVMLEVSVRISVCAVGAAATSGVALASIVTSTLCTSAEIGSDYIANRCRDRTNLSIMRAALRTSRALRSVRKLRRSGSFALTIHNSIRQPEWWRRRLATPSTPQACTRVDLLMGDERGGGNVKICVRTCRLAKPGRL